MRHGYSTITPATVHALARDALQPVLGSRTDARAVTPRRLLDLVLLIAGTARTLFAITRRYFPFSHETARRAVYDQLPDLDVLTNRLVDALHRVAAFTRRDRRRAWTIAIDTHYVPYYGARTAPRVLGGQRKQGTKYFHCYATAVLIHRRRRYTVGLLSVQKGLKPHEQVQALLAQIASRGLVIGGVVLDAWFDSGETLLLLQRMGVSYTVPLRRKGSGTNRRNACHAQPSGTIATVSWVTETSRQSVSTRVLVWQRAGEARARVYAFAGWGAGTAVSEQRRAWLGRRRYRERFGIETSYRQKNEARGWTTSRRADYRLLLEGVALVLRQAWVHLTQQVARARGLSPKAWVAELPLNNMLDWLTDHIRAQYPHTRQIILNYKPLAP